MMEPISAPANATSASSQAQPVQSAGSLTELVGTLSAELAPQATAAEPARYLNSTDRRRSSSSKAREAVEDIVIRNLLDSLSPTYRVGGSSYPAEPGDTAGRSLISAFYEAV